VVSIAVVSIVHPFPVAGNVLRWPQFLNLECNESGCGSAHTFDPVGNAYVEYACVRLDVRGVARIVNCTTTVKLSTRIYGHSWVFFTLISDFYMQTSSWCPSAFWNNFRCVCYFQVWMSFRISLYIPWSTFLFLLLFSVLYFVYLFSCRISSI
jgi:hypothetical protein